MTLENVVNVTLIIGGIVGIVTLVKGVFEYSRQCAQKRAEYFIGLRERFNENHVFREICQELEEKSATLADMPFKEKR